MNNSYSSYYNNINDGFDMDPNDELYNMARNMANNSTNINNDINNTNNIKCRPHKKPILNRSRNNFLFDSDELSDIDTNYIRRSNFNPEPTYPEQQNNIGIVGQDYYSAWGDYEDDMNKNNKNDNNDTCSDNNIEILLKKYQESKSNTTDFDHIKKCLKCQKKLAKLIEKKKHVFDSDSDDYSNSYDSEFESKPLNPISQKYKQQNLKYKLENQMLQNQLLQQQMLQMPVKASVNVPISSTSSTLSVPVSVPNQTQNTDTDTDKSNKIIITKDLLLVIIVGIIIILMLDILVDKTKY